MTISTSPFADVVASASFDQHEMVEFCQDSATGLRAIIAVHNSALGPAVGGCRMFPYTSDAQALEDVLRLSRGMTYKSALAGLPMGGGKAVIIGDHRKIKTPELLKVMGRFIDSLNGRYMTAEDSGTSVDDMKLIRRETPFVSGVSDNQQFGGDPSPLTALGIFCGIQAAVKHRLGKDNLIDVRVAIQGVGAVGYYLAKQLLAVGAKVMAADINSENRRRIAALGAEIINPDDIISVDAEVFCPCAMGAVINDHSIANLGSPIVAGGANNQLAEMRHAELLRQRGVLYAPDFVINAGGIIDIHYQNQEIKDNDAKDQASCAHISKIGDTLSDIFTSSDQLNLSTAVVAEKLAEERFKPAAMDAA